MKAKVNTAQNADNVSRGFYRTCLVNHDGKHKLTVEKGEVV